jgi:hypothetical protein
MKSAIRIWICLDGFTTHFTTHFTTNTTNTTQPHIIPTTTCAMKFSSCLFWHGFCSGLQHAERNRYSGLCWPRLSRGWLPLEVLWKYKSKRAAERAELGKNKKRGGKE